MGIMQQVQGGGKKESIFDRRVNILPPALSIHNDVKCGEHFLPARHVIRHGKNLGINVFAKYDICSTTIDDEQYLFSVSK